MRYFVNSFPDFVAGSAISIDASLWKNRVLQSVDKILQAVQPKPGNCDGGLYVGCAGIAYALYHVARLDLFSDRRAELLRRAKAYVDVSLEYSQKRSSDPETAFLLGGAGVYVVGSVVNDAMGQSDAASELIQKYHTLANKLQPLHFFKSGSDELFVGRAGYVCGSVFLNRHRGNQMFGDVQSVLCQAMTKSGREYSQQHKSPAPLMYAYYDTEYLGAAHGLSAILQMLLSCPQYLQSDQSALNDVRTSVDFMLSLMQPNGNIAPAMDEVGRSARRPEDELVHWCHGAPGIVYLFAKAYRVFQDQRYLDACIRCADLTWTAGLLRKGPGICHGVAGSGYVFLLLYRLTGDQKYLHRALKFAEFMYTKEFLEKSRTPDCPYSLYEGLAGTVCFLADLIHPQQAEFPFFDVFS